MDLNEAITKVLQQNGAPMSTHEIADRINEMGLYQRSDGTEVCNFQIHSRTFNNPNLFVKKGNLVALNHNTGKTIKK